MPKLFPNRKYASGVGTKFAFFRWSDAQLPYLDRLFLIKTPWFSVCLNWILDKDPGEPHDHNAAFFSLFLRGWYVERRITNWNGAKIDVTVRRRFWNYMRACDWDAHRILSVAPRGGALTLCLMGPKVREWYYHTKHNGKVLWSDYDA